MANSATVYVFDVGLSDVDRGVYETLSLKVAQHPSETVEYMVARVLAYALEYTEGIAFSQGLAVADEPAVWVHDLTGQLQTWIEVGTPASERLHKASKAADKVVVFCHKDTEAYLQTLAKERVYAPEKISIVGLDRPFIDAIAALVDRRTTLEVSVNDGTLYVDVGGESLSIPLLRRPFPR